jgi:acetoacetyl-CoA synthetase
MTSRTQAKANTPIWCPSTERMAASNVTAFMRWLNERSGVVLADYSELYTWSIENKSLFWEAIWNFCGVKSSQRFTSVLDGNSIINARWFEGARLNFAENLLRYRDERIALIGAGEDQVSVEISYADLYIRVAQVASALRQNGVSEGDRVAGFLPNIPEAVIAMLATTSIGAIWSSCSPDFGLQGVMDRFGQIAPKVLFTADGYRYHGKQYDSLERVAKLVEQIPSIERVVVIPQISTQQSATISKSILWSDFVDTSATTITFAQLPFDHPVYIMYSSGTTGVPKCMVHGAGGTLLQHLKELMLHTDLHRDDVITYYTTCGWMMWNWLVSSLAVGSSVVLIDGSPAYPNVDRLFKCTEELGITILGTSPKYLSSCQNNNSVPKDTRNLSRLRTILSTGSPLSADNFRWVYSSVKSDLQLSSISGGTDIVSCFMLGCPLLPVYEGEITTRGLGMQVEVYDSKGNAIIDEVGELVCTAPFPSRPVYFWNDPDGRKYHSAYFEHFNEVWRHGDFVRLNSHGGVVVYGRSDATLNPGGVRIGTSEIYAPVEAMAEIEDCLVVGQRWDNDVRIILFVVVANGMTLTDDLRARIRSQIRESETPRHVPAKIIAIHEVPRTISGKKVEMAVTQIIHGEEVANRDALANPHALDQFTNLPDLHR